MKKEQGVARSNVGLSKSQTIDPRVVSLLPKESVEVYKASAAPKIRDLVLKEDIDVLAALLTKWRLYVGLPEPTEQALAAELVLNVNFIRRNFDGLSLQDIDLAIEWSIAGKFKVDANLYGAGLGPMYISKILNAYVAYQRSVNMVIISARNEVMIEAAKEPEPTPEEAREAFHATLIKWWDLSKIGKYKPDFGSYVYNGIKDHQLAKISAVEEAEFRATAIKSAEKALKKNDTIYQLERMRKLVDSRESDKEYYERKNFEMLVIRRFLKLFDKSSEIPYL